MLVEVIKEFKKHVTIHKVGDTLGVTKDLARHLIKEGLVIDVNNVLKLSKGAKTIIKEDKVVKKVVKKTTKTKKK